MLVWPFFLLSEEVRRPLIMTPITSPSPGEGACSAAFPPWTASRIRERLGAFLHDGSLASWAGPHVLRLAPSLLLSDEDLDAGMERLRAAVGACASTRYGSALAANYVP